MKGIFKGYISTDKNAVFEVPAKMSQGFVISVKLLELKDGVNSDNFCIDEEYDVEGLVK